MQNRIRIGSLWTAKTKSGEEYYSGTFGSSARLLVFRNSYRDGDNPPDFAVYLVPREREEGSGGDAPQQGPDASPPQATRRIPLRTRPNDSGW